MSNGGYYDSWGQWVPEAGYPPLGSYRPAKDIRERGKTAFVCKEVSPGVLYVVEVDIANYDRYMDGPHEAMFPMGSNLVATFEAAFPDAPTSIVRYPVEDHMDSHNRYWETQW